MTAALDRCTAALGHPNVRAFLRVIREGESSHDDGAYTVMYGGAHFTAPPWRHPYHGIPTTQGALASGAYQFLGTTWARCSDALGLGGDFSPSSQDAAAVYLIEGRGALEAVIAGNLVLAIAKLAQEWVSLPGLGLARAQRVFLDYGGAYAAAQEGQGAAIPPAEPSTPIPTEKKPMLPLLLPSVISLIPQLIGILGKGGERAAQNAQAAQAVADAVIKATDAVNLQQAVEKMQADPELKATATAAVLQEPAIASLLEVGGGIPEAHKYALAQSDPSGPWWRFLANAAFYIALVTIPLIYMVVYRVLWDGGSSEQLKTVVVTAILSGLLGSVTGFFFGSAYSNTRTRPTTPTP